MGGGGRESEGERERERERGKKITHEQESKRAREVDKTQATQSLINFLKDFDLHHQNNIENTVWF